MDGLIIAVSRSATHALSKESLPSIRLIRGLGVEGDAHLGVTVQHLSHRRRDPDRSNYRQVHLIHAELYDELRVGGFALVAGQLGENVTTRGIDLLGLPAGTELRLGAQAVIRITGLRDPCAQLDGVQKGLMAAVLDRDEAGRLIRKAGVMAVVLTGGEVLSGDPITVVLPSQPHQPLEPV